MKKKMYATTSGLLLGGLFLFNLSGCTTMSQLTSWLPFTGGQSGYFQQRHSGQIKSYYKAACVYQEKNQHRRAIDEFEKILRENPAHVKAYNGMGVSYDQLREFRKAIGCYKAALRIDPNVDYIYNNLGYSLLMQGQLDGAVDAFRNAIALNKGNGRYHNNLGLAYSQKGEIHLAQAEFKLGKGVKEILPEQRALVEEKIADEVGANQASTLSPATIIPQKKEMQPVRQKVEVVTAALFPEEQDAQLKPSPRLPDTPAVVSKVNVTNRLPVESSQVKNKDETLKEIDARQTQQVVLGVDLQHHPLPKEHPVAQRESTSMGAGSISQPAVAVKPIELPAESNITAAQPAPAKESSPLATNIESAKHTIEIEVANGNGGHHTAKKWGDYLLKKGQEVSLVTNADHFHYKKTMVYYRDGYLQEAYQVAKLLPLYQNMKMVKDFEGSQIKVKVVIGEDMVRFGGKFLGNFVMAKAKI